MQLNEVESISWVAKEEGHGKQNKTEQNTTVLN